MRDRRGWLRTAGVGAVVVLAFGWMSPAWAPLCPSGCMRTTSLLLPLSGTFFYSRSPLFPG